MCCPCRGSWFSLHTKDQWSKLSVWNDSVDIAESCLNSLFCNFSSSSLRFHKLSMLGKAHEFSTRLQMAQTTFILLRSCGKFAGHVTHCRPRLTKLIKRNWQRMFPVRKAPLGAPEGLMWTKSQIPVNTMFTSVPSSKLRKTLIMQVASLFPSPTTPTCLRIRTRKKKFFACQVYIFTWTWKLLSNHLPAQLNLSLLDGRITLDSYLSVGPKLYHNWKRCKWCKANTKMAESCSFLTLYDGSLRGFVAGNAIDRVQLVILVSPFAA